MPLSTQPLDALPEFPGLGALPPDALLYAFSPATGLGYRVPAGRTGTGFVAIAANQYGSHPAFTTEADLFAYLLGRSTAPAGAESVAVTAVMAGTNTVTVSATKANTIKAIEYSLNGTAFQDSNVFTGVPAGTIAAGSITARLKGSAPAITATWNTPVTVAGAANTTPTPPSWTFDAGLRILSLSHPTLAASELEYQLAPATTWTAYSAGLSIDGATHPAGYALGRVKAATGRNASSPASSPAIDAAAAAPSTLPINLIVSGDSIQDYTPSLTGANGSAGTTAPGHFAAARISAPAATLTRLGYPGESVTEWNNLHRAAFDAALAPSTSKRNIVVFAFGANDINQRPIAQIEADYLSAIAYAKSKGCEVVVMPVMNRTDGYGYTFNPANTADHSGPFNPTRLALNSWIVNNAAANGYTAAPASASPDMYADGYASDGSLEYDGVHPTSKGTLHQGEGTMAEGIALLGGITLAGRRLDAPRANGAVATTATTATPTWLAVPNAAGYQVERATNSTFTTGLTTVYTGTALTFTDSGLTASTAYFYRITATATAPLRNSPYSDALSATTTAAASGGSTPVAFLTPNANATVSGNTGTGKASIPDFSGVADANQKLNLSGTISGTVVAKGAKGFFIGFSAGKHPTIDGAYNDLVGLYIDAYGSTNLWNFGVQTPPASSVATNALVGLKVDFVLTEQATNLSVSVKINGAASVWPDFTVPTANYFATLRLSDGDSASMSYTATGLIAN